MENLLGSERPYTAVIAVKSIGTPNRSTAWSTVITHAVTGFEPAQVVAGPNVDILEATPPFVKLTSVWLRAALLLALLLRSHVKVAELTAIVAPVVKRLAFILIAHGLGRPSTSLIVVAQLGVIVAIAREELG